MRYSATTVAAVPGGSAVTTRGATDVDVVGGATAPAPAAGAALDVTDVVGRQQHWISAPG